MKACQTFIFSHKNPRILPEQVVIQLSPFFAPQPSLYTPFSNFKLRLTVIYNLNSSLPTTTMSLEKDDPFGSRSRQTTEEDSSSDRDEEPFYPRTNPAKHKTELCKTYSQLGHCPYEHKCRFAHGKHELIHAPPKAASKNRKCNGFWKNGCCSYGIRCQFGHSQSKWQARAVLSGLQAANQHCSAIRTSKLMQLLQ